MMHIPRFFLPMFDRLELPDSTRSFIIDMHTQPGRYYHGLGHLAMMKKHMISSCVRRSEGMAVQQHLLDYYAAILFHDIIYDPRAASGENEKNSAAEFILRAPKNVNVDFVQRLILATQSHDLNQETAISLFLRLDLHILWHRRPQIYQWYARAIRKEYAWVNNEQYRIGRAGVLNNLSSVEMHLEVVELQWFWRNIKWEKQALASGELDV